MRGWRQVREHLEEGKLSAQGKESSLSAGLRGLGGPGAGGYPQSSGQQARLCRAAGRWEGRGCPRCPRVRGRKAEEKGALGCWEGPGGRQGRVERGPWEGRCLGLKGPGHH